MNDIYVFKVGDKVREKGEYSGLDNNLPGVVVGYAFNIEYARSLVLIELDKGFYDPSGKNYTGTVVIHPDNLVHR